MKEHTRAKVLSAICRKIRLSLDSKPDGCEKLMLEVIFLAIREAFSSNGYIPHSDRRSAYLYIKSDMPHAQAIGIDPDWIRLLIKKAGIELKLHYPKRDATDGVDSGISA